MAFEEAGVKLVAEGASAYMGDLKSATGATDTFVDTTEKGGGIVSKAGGMMGSAIKGVATIAAGLGVAAFVGLGKSIFDGMGDAREAAKLYASTEQTIQTMGNAAGRSADQVVDLATNLSDASGMSLFGDDQIQQSENLLLTFGNIKGETFDLATALTVDLAQALGGAPADQAMMLGKALQDPVKGITALGKAGLTFSEEQKEVIKTMVESGDIAGAQAIIIDELNKQVGGQAAAAAAADGGWTQFTATLGELQESLGAAFLPLMNEVVSFLNTNLLPVVESVVEVFGNFVESGFDLNVLATSLQDVFGIDIKPFADGIQNVIDAFADAGPMSSEFGEALGYLADQLGLPGDLIQDIAFAVQDVVKWFGSAGDKSSDLGGALDDLNGIWELVLKIVGEVADGYMAIIQAVLPQIQKFISDHGEEIDAFFKTTWDTIIQIITLALEVYEAVVPPVLQAIAQFISDHGEEIQKILGAVWQVISSIITGTLATLQAAIKLVLDAIHGDWDAVWKDIQTIVDAQVTAIKGIVEGFLNAIAGFFNTSLADIGKVWESNWQALQDLVTKIDWTAIGQGIIDGIEAGISSAWGAFSSWVIGQLDGLKDSVLAFFGIASPSKVFAQEVGEPIVQGIMMGMEDEWPALIDMVHSFAPDLVDEMENIGEQMNQAIADGFSSTATIDRQIAKNLDRFKDVLPQYQSFVEGSLQEAKLASQELLDPKEGARFYKMKSDQIFEYAKLQKDLSKAETQEDKDRISAQMLLINRAQTAELAAFDTTKATVSPMQEIANQINDVMKSISGLELTDEQIHVVDMLAGVFGRAVSPPAVTRTPYNPGATTTNTTNINMPIHTNNTPAALQQSWAIMQASMT